MDETGSNLHPSRMSESNKHESNKHENFENMRVLKCPRLFCENLDFFGNLKYSKVEMK